MLCNVMLPLTGIHELHMHQLVRCNYNLDPRGSRRRVAINISPRFVPGDQPDVFFELPLLVAICGTDLPHNVLHIPQYNAGFISYPKVGTRIQFQIRKQF